MSHETQAQRLLRLLEHSSPWWVGLPTIMSLNIASHTRRIHELRKAGHEIEIRNEYVDGQRRTAYRLIKSA